MQAPKASPGGFAMTVFMGSAVYLVLLDHGWQTLLTFKAVTFLLLGAFLSVLLLGVPFHLLRIRIAKRYVNAADVSAATIRQLKWLSTMLMVLQVIATFYATKLAYGWYFG